MRLLAIPLICAVVAACSTIGGSSASDSASLSRTQILPGCCARCHGAEGRGDGPMATAMTPKPRDFTDRAWQASVSDEHLATVIREGGAAVGLSPLMLPHAGCVDNDQALAAMVRRVRACAE